MVYVLRVQGDGDTVLLEAFSTEAKALAHLARWCRLEWANADLEGEPPSGDDEVNVEYFRRVGYGWWSVTGVVVDEPADLGD